MIAPVLTLFRAAMKLNARLPGEAAILNIQSGSTL